MKKNSWKKSLRRGTDFLSRLKACGWFYANRIDKLNKFCVLNKPFLLLSFLYGIIKCI